MVGVFSAKDVKRLGYVHAVRMPIVINYEANSSCYCSVYISSGHAIAALISSML